MKINLETIDRSQFMVHEHMVNGEMLYLVQPQHIGATWNRQNKIFRSSVWNTLGELVSAGFPKFVNWGESPEVFPFPTSLKGTTVVEKVDGSLLVVSKYKGNYILRTRGTVDATKMDNGYELEIFKETILPILDRRQLHIDTWDYSYLFEWTSPVNKIVLNYGDIPNWILVGGIKHKDYSLWSQVGLDNAAYDYGWERPATYTFSSIENLMVEIDQWKGKEGVCVYFNNDQSILKVKSPWYLVRHHMKSELSSLEKTMDFWFLSGKPDFLGFQEQVVQFDPELWVQPTMGFASKISEGWKEVQKIIAHMKGFVESRLLPLGDPKDKKNRGQMAQCVLQAYGNTNRAAFVFTLLDDKELDNKDIKKLMFQVLKN